MLACCRSPVTRTSVMVTNPSRGSRSPLSSRFATISLMRSAIFLARAGSAMFSALPRPEDVAPSGSLRVQVYRGKGPRSPPEWRNGDPILELRAGLLPHLDRLDLVADLDVVELAEADTGFEVRAHLGDVVLEATQRLDGKVVADDDAIADDPSLGVSRDRSRPHDDTGDVAELRGTEHLADLGDARLDLFELGLQHALQRVLDVVDRVVDDRVEAHVDALTGSALARLHVGTHVEPDDDRVVDRREVDVALGDGTHTAVEDAQLHAVVDLDLHERLFERLDGTRHVALDDEVERLDLALFERTGEVLERDALAGLRELCVALGRF